MNERDEAFEAWATKEGLISESHGVRFVNSMCDVARMAWHASRRAALDEAVRAIPSHDDEGTIGWMNANGIRALSGASK